MNIAGSNRGVARFPQNKMGIPTISEIYGIIIGCSAQTTATGERRVANARHAVRYRYARESGALLERKAANARHAVSDGYARQAVARSERRTANARHAVSDGYARQAGAFIERIGANARSTGNNDRFQGCRDIRGIITI